MKRLLAALLLVASTALGQSNGWQEIQNGWGEIQTPTGGSSTPATCTTSGMVPVFLGSPLALGCDAGLTYDAGTGTLTVGGQVTTPSVYAQGNSFNIYGLTFADNAPSTAIIRWYGASGYDSGLRRVSPGLVGVTDGSTGDGAISAKGFKYVTGSRPTCDAAARGMTWYVAGGSGAADTIEVCGKAAADTYSWVALATF